MRFNGSLHGLGTSAILTQFIWLMRGGGYVCLPPSDTWHRVRRQESCCSLLDELFRTRKGGRISSVLQNSLESRPTLSVAGCMVISTYI